MQNIKKYTAKALTGMLSLTLLTQMVFADNVNNKVSYLDSVSSSYLYNQSGNTAGASEIITDESIEATIQLDSSQKLTDKNIRINLSLRKADVREVLRMLADKAGLNIVLPGTIQGPMTVDFKDVDINDVFNMILSSRRLIYVNIGNIVYVYPSTNASYPRQKMTVIPVKYVNAGALATFLNTNSNKSNNCVWYKC